MRPSATRIVKSSGPRPSVFSPDAFPTSTADEPAAGGVATISGRLPATCAKASRSSSAARFSAGGASVATTIGPEATSAGFTSALALGAMIARAATAAHRAW